MSNKARIITKPIGVQHAHMYTVHEKQKEECTKACQIIIIMMVSKWWSREVTHYSGLHTTLFPFYLICLIIPESSGLQYTWHTAHSCSKDSALTLNYVLVIYTLLISYASHVNSSSIILFLKTLPVHAWACICHRWRDTSVGTTVDKMFPGDVHYEWI